MISAAGAEYQRDGLRECIYAAAGNSAHDQAVRLCLVDRLAGIA